MIILQHPGDDYFLEAERSETQTHPMPQDPSEVIQEKKQFTFP